MKPVQLNPNSYISLGLMAMVVGGVLWIVNGQRSSDDNLVALHRAIDKAFSDFRIQTVTKDNAFDNRIKAVEGGQRDVYRILKESKLTP